MSCDATPCTWKLPRNSTFAVTITKPGFKPVTAQVVHQTSGAGAAGMAGNVLVGGLIGVGVDAVSGATQELKPNPLVVKLEPVTSAEATPAAPAADAPAASASASTDVSAAAAPSADVAKADAATVSTDAKPMP